MRYIQAAVSDEDHRAFTVFACQNEMTLSELVGTAVNHYIRSKEYLPDKQVVLIQSGEKINS